MAWLLPSLWLRLAKLTLLDCFLLSIALYFGAYTLIDAFSSEPFDAEPGAVFTVFAIFIGASLILWAVARRPSALLLETSLDRFRQDLVACSPVAVIAMLAVAVVYRWYTADFFAERHVLGSDPALVEADMPYWLTSLGMIASTAVFPAGLAAWGKARASAGFTRLLWFALVGVSCAVILGMGRRAIFAFLVIVGWDVMSQAMQQRRRLLTLVVLALSVPALITLSNLFQAYRLAVYRGVAIEAMDLDPASLVEAASDVDKTIANLEERKALWRYNYDLANADLRGEGRLQGGELFLSGIGNYVPAFINPQKVVVDTELETLMAFGLPLIDSPDNIFASTYADFGVSSVLVAPALILFFVFACASVLAWLTDPFLRVLLMGAAIFYALNMENAYHFPIGIARDFAFIATIYLTACAAGRTMASIVRLAVHPIKQPPPPLP